MIHFIHLLRYNYLRLIKQVRISNHQIHQKAVKEKQGS